MMKKAVFLIHGFLTGERDFEPLYPYLEQKYDKVHLFNIPGHKDRIFEKFTLEDTFSNLLTEFDEIQKEYEYIDVIGYSLGGCLSTYLSNVRKFNKLVLLAPANKYLKTRFPLFKTKSYFENFKEYLICHDKDIFNTVLVDDITSLKLLANGVLSKDIIKALNTFVSVTAYANRHVKKIDNETLIIWGEMDELVPKESVFYVYDKCRNKSTQVHIMRKLGHIMLYSKDHMKIINIINEFLGINIDKY
jgi:esterase/lipase